MEDELMQLACRKISCIKDETKAQTYADAALAAAGTILIPQRADDLIVGIGYGE